MNFIVSYVVKDQSNGYWHSRKKVLNKLIELLFDLKSIIIENLFNSPILDDLLDSM